MTKKETTEQPLELTPADLVTQFLDDKKLTIKDKVVVDHIREDVAKRFLELANDL